MAKPTTKSELLVAAREGFERLEEILDSLSKDQLEKEFQSATLNRNIRDVLTHLSHWHLLFLQWHKEGMSGKKPAMPAENYSWKEMPALNRWINEHYQNTSVAEAREMLFKSHLEAVKIINKYSQNELFTKKKYKWTGSTSLAVYIISNTSSHYRWAIKLIRSNTKK